MRISTDRTVERRTRRLRSLIHALPKHAAGVYGAGKRNKFLPFWKCKIFVMAPEPSAEEETSSVIGPSCLAPRVSVQARAEFGYRQHFETLYPGVG